MKIQICSFSLKNLGGSGYPVGKEGGCPVWLLSYHRPHHSLLCPPSLPCSLPPCLWAAALPQPPTSDGDTVHAPLTLALNPAMVPVALEEHGRCDRHRGHWSGTREAESGMRLGSQGSRRCRGTQGAAGSLASGFSDADREKPRAHSPRAHHRHGTLDPPRGSQIQRAKRGSQALRKLPDRPQTSRTGIRQVSRWSLPQAEGRQERREAAGGGLTLWEEQRWLCGGRTLPRGGAGPTPTGHPHGPGHRAAAARENEPGGDGVGWGGGETESYRQRDRDC